MIDAKTAALWAEKNKVSPVLVPVETNPRGTLDDTDYHDYLKRVNNRFTALMADGKPLFTTDVPDLFGVYLEAFPLETRQHHKCNCCRHFINKYGSLVTINESGEFEPAIWSVDDAYGEYVDVVKAMIGAIVKSKVTGVFISDEKTWGTPETGVWQHLFVVPPKEIIYRGKLFAANQAMAEKREDRRNITRALQLFSLDAIKMAVSVLNSDHLFRSEKVLGPAQWLHDLQTWVTGTKNQSQRNNIVWRAVATAPAGFCHPRSSMIGTLLEDILDGKDFDAIAKAFKAKMAPDLYQRPQAAPAAGNIAQAEQIIEKMGIASALDRRFARLDEIPTIWRPDAINSAISDGSVFGHLKPENKKLKPLTLPPIKITWEKFARTLLHTAKMLEISIPRTGNFIALVTAADPDAKPIVAWDHEEQRNPVSWYGYVNGSNAEQWNLNPGAFGRITAIAKKPSEWYRHYPQWGHGITFIIEGAKDTRNAHSALFSEILKSELHSIRATIEAHAKTQKLSGSHEASACGLMISDAGFPTVELRMTDENSVVSTYRIDRWD